MQKLNYLILFFLLSISIACSSSTTNENQEEANVEAAETTATEETPQETQKSTDNTEEIANLRAYMQTINDAINKEEYRMEEIDKDKYSIENYYNKEDKLVKRIVNVYNDSGERWTTYYKPTAQSTKEAYTIYGSSTIDPVTNRTTLIQFLQVGSLDENAQATRTIGSRGQRYYLRG